MNNNFTIDELITNYFEREFSEVIDIPTPKFSLKHKIKMNWIFRKFEKNTRKKSSNSAVKPELSNNKHFTLKQRLIITVTIIICLAFVTGFVMIYVSKGFQGTVYTDNTHLFPINVDDCPSTIEKVYTLSVVPEGYEMYEISTISTNNSIVYRNSTTGQTLLFEQTVKSEFNSHINTEGYFLQETTINGYNAVCVEYNRGAGFDSLIIWDSKDYILTLDGNFDKNELINLAISNENCGF